jgi:hypothetical protein
VGRLGPLYSLHNKLSMHLIRALHKQAWIHAMLNSLWLPHTSADVTRALVKAWEFKLLAGSLNSHALLEALVPGYLGTCGRCVVSLSMRHIGSTHRVSIAN